MMDFDQILLMHWYGQNPGKYHYKLIFIRFQLELWPLIDVKILFSLNILSSW